MQDKLSERIASVSESSTARLTSVVNAMQLNGEKIINLSVGEPDFPTPQNIISAARSAMARGLVRYTEVSGIKPLREAISLKLARENKVDYDATEIVVCNGAKQAIFNVLQVLCNPGDEVILPCPYWVSFKAQIELAGGIPVIVDCIKSGDLDVSLLRRKISKKTKAFIINSPNNPTGAVFSRKSLGELANVAAEHGIFIISDEVYEKFVYEGRHLSIASVSDEIRNLVIAVNSFSKTYCMTGWRVGYLAAPEKIAELVRKLQSHSTGNASAISQYAALEALSGPQDCVSDMVSEFKKRRRCVARALNLPLPRGAFYFFPGLSGRSSAAFCESLLKKDGIALAPGDAFGVSDHFRLAYCVPPDKLESAVGLIMQRLGSNA